MYGLVNEGIKSYLMEHVNKEFWHQVCEECFGVKDKNFEALATYPDEDTYHLVSIICEELNLSSEEVLEAYGRYWVQFVNESGYHEIMNFFGSNYKDMLFNLNRMHRQIVNTMPELNPPDFYTEELSSGHIEVTYRSTREGLIPMVKGLLLGLAEKYNVEVDVSCVLSESSAAKFSVQIKENQVERVS